MGYDEEGSLYTHLKKRLREIFNDYLGSNNFGSDETLIYAIKKIEDYKKNKRNKMNEVFHQFIYNSFSPNLKLVRNAAISVRDLDSFIAVLRNRIMNMLYTTDGKHIEPDRYFMEFNLDCIEDINFRKVASENAELNKMIKIFNILNTSN